MAEPNLAEAAEVTGLPFKAENGAQIVEVAFAYQRVELEHTPSGTRVAP